nr:alkaline/neutral invertase CINV2-like [Populus alba]
MATGINEEGINGYPIEIQALFYFALRCAKQMLRTERDSKGFIERIEKRITDLSCYLIGNASPARMDFRWFLVGNCIAILSSLVTPAQGHEWRIVTGFDPKNTSWSYHDGGSWPSE